MMSQTACSKSVALTPVDECVDRTMDRSKLRHWGFTRKDAAKLRKDLKDHESPFTPTCVSIWLGSDLQYNWSEAISWLRDEVGALGHNLVSFFEPNRLSYLSGLDGQRQRNLRAVKLDLETFWDPQIGVCGLDILPDRQLWPTTEVPCFLAMNPQVAVNMDGVTIPYMYTSGLIVNKTGTPCFYHDLENIYVISDWQNSQNITKYGTFVAFAE